jgi:hypothetical protein
MTYLPTMGSIDVSNFNDTKFPGVAYATNPVTHALYILLQVQLNRAAYARKMPTRLPVDGKIGSDTQGLAKAIGFANTETVHSVASHADSIAVGARAIADSAGAPDKVPSPIPSAPPKIIMPSGDLVTAPPMVGASALDSLKNLGMPTLAMLGVAAVGVGYLVYKRKAK